MSYQQLIDQLHGAKNREVRHLAAFVLGEIAHPADIVPLVERALCKTLRRSDEDPYVRREVVMSLGKLGTKKALHALIDVVLDDEDSQTVRLALHLLKMREPPAVVREFIDILQDLATSSIERAKAAHALGVLGGGEQLAPPALLETLMRDPDAPVREAAAAALSVYRAEAILLRKPGGISALQMELKTLVMVAIDDEDAQVRVAAAHALGRMAAAAHPRPGCLIWLGAMLDRPDTAEIWRRVVRQFEQSRRS